MDIKDGGYPKFLETALMNSRQSIIYIDDWGYWDVIRFYGSERASEESNVNDLIAEILRVRQLILDNPSYWSRAFPSTGDDDDDDDDDENGDDEDEE